MGKIGLERWREGVYTRYKIQETLFNVGYMIIGNISSSELFSDKTCMNE